MAPSWNGIRSPASVLMLMLFVMLHSMVRDDDETCAWTAKCLLLANMKYA